jgi:hypothetical protein
LSGDRNRGKAAFLAALGQRPLEISSLLPGHHLILWATARAAQAPAEGEKEDVQTKWAAAVLAQISFVTKRIRVRKIRPAISNSFYGEFSSRCAHATVTQLRSCKGHIACGVDVNRQQGPISY